MKNGQIELFSITIILCAAITKHAVFAISPLECVVDSMALHLDSNAFVEQNGTLVPLQMPPIILAEGPTDQQFEALISCAGDEWVDEWVEGGRRRFLDVSKMLEQFGWGSQEMEQYTYGQLVHISEQLQYVFDCTKCVINYAAVHYAYSKTEMISMDMSRVSIRSLPDRVEPKMRGYKELKKCILLLKMPRREDRSVLGDLPVLFRQKTEKSKSGRTRILSKFLNKTQKICKFGSDNNYHREYIDVHALTKHPIIGKNFLRNYSVPSKEISQSIANEMRCTGTFMAQQLMSKTIYVLGNRIDSTAKILVRRLDDERNPINIIGQREQTLWMLQCAQSLVRFNAIRSQGLIGMLRNGYGQILIGSMASNKLNILSVYLADYLANKYVLTGKLKIVQTSQKALLICASLLGDSVSTFRVQLHPNLKLAHRLNPVYPIDFKILHFLANYTALRHLAEATVAQLVAMFATDQLFLSKKFMANYFAQNEDKVAVRLYGNLSCLADYMVIYKNKTPKFVAKGQIVPNGFSKVLYKSTEGHTNFAQIVYCMGDDKGWIVRDEGGEQFVEVDKYMRFWGGEEQRRYYRVSWRLAKILEKAQCIADYLVINVQGIVLHVSDRGQFVRIDERSMPEVIEEDGPGQFDQLISCIGKSDEGEESVLRHFAPFILAEGKKRKILLKTNKDTFGLFLKHFYISEQLNAIIKAKLACISRSLLEKSAFRLSYRVQRQLDEEEQSVETLINLEIVEPKMIGKEIIKSTNCAEIFARGDQWQKRAEEGLNGRDLMELSEGALIGLDDMKKLENQSMCLASFLALHFDSDHIVRVTDRDELDFVSLIGALPYKFRIQNAQKFSPKLKQIFKVPQIFSKIEHLAKCLPQILSIEWLKPNGTMQHIFELFRDKLGMFDQNQLFLGASVDLTAFLPDLLPNLDAEGKMSKDSNENVCAICLEPLLEKGKKLLRCNHHFHPQCIRPWLEQQNECPLCRSKIFLELDG